MVFEYEFMGQTVRLEPDDNLVAVRFKEPAQHSTRAAVSARSGLGPFTDRIELPGEKYTIIPVSQTAAARSVRHHGAVESLEASNDVTRVAPVFKLGEQTVVATDRVLIGFKEQAEEVNCLLQELKCEIVEEREREYLVRIPEDACPFELARRLLAMKEVEYAEPDFVTIGKHIALHAPSPIAGQPSPLAAGDPLLSRQYAPRITKAIDAWNLQVGDPAIKIAILDEGVDTNHEDLKAAIVGSYDGIDDDAFQEPNSWDGHGTACAGLAAAVPNNNRGIRGIGGGCSLLAVRMAQSLSPTSRWSTSNSIIARSIDWAWKSGAAVLSNSWSGGAPSTAIVNAFERARKQGRGGKGAVIVIAAGNGSGPVYFPSNLPNVLTVSASNEFDQFKTKTSSDGEHWWGSDFGPEVDVAAPGVHNLTTDISGSAGYTSTNYTDFNGTSSACPIVAGAVGLVLSANKDLTEAEVRKIITQSADKVGALPYFNGRNDQFGFGRLNVLNAVKEAQQAGGPPTLNGTIVQLGSGASKVPAFFLQMADGRVFLLHRYTGEEGTARSVLELQSLEYLSRFAGTTRTVSFAQRQDTPSGVILWGVSLT
jgi:thermitase